MIALQTSISGLDRMSAPSRCTPHPSPAAKSNYTFIQKQFYWIHKHSTQELRKSGWCYKMLYHWSHSDSSLILQLHPTHSPGATMENWPFPWRGNAFKQDLGRGKEPTCISLLLCKGDVKHLHAGPRGSTDTAPNEKYRGHWWRALGTCWFVWVFRRKTGSYCFWWVLNVQ